MSNILITSAGRRVSLVQFFKKELKKIDTLSKVFTADLNPNWSSACQFSDASFQLPKVSDKNYITSLIELCKQQNIKIVIPTIDTELYIFSISKDEFDSLGIKIVISDNDFIDLCRDKRKTKFLFESLDIETPNLVDKRNPTFPLFIKPYDGSLSKGIYFIENETQLSKSLLVDPKLIFMEYINPDIYDEYTVDAYYDINSNLKCLVPRRRVEVRGGEISKGLTVKTSFYYILKRKLSFVSGARGCITFQFFVHKINMNIIGIEINPRFGGGYPLSYTSGANFPQYIIEEYLLGNQIDFFEGWKKNNIMLRYDSEIYIDGSYS